MKKLSFFLCLFDNVLSSLTQETEREQGRLEQERSRPVMLYCTFPSIVNLYLLINRSSDLYFLDDTAQRTHKEFIFLIPHILFLNL